MNGIELITAERTRQIEVEGFTAEYDKRHNRGELAQAACYYAMIDDVKRWSEDRFFFAVAPPFFFPDNWHLAWAKRDSKTRIQQLACAGALIAAEIDRLQGGEK